MKIKTLLFSILLLWTAGFSTAWAQAPQGINYQALVRNSGGNVLNNASVTFRFSFHEGSPTGTISYEETIATTTDAYGMANVVLGQGNTVSGSFGAVDWSQPYFLETELNATGSYVSLGTSAFQSVPYALNSSSAWFSNGAAIYYNSGDVGIGTNNPQAKLDITGNIRINGVDAGRGNGGNFNTAFGENAMRNTTSNSNSAYGHHSMEANTTGFDNAAFGTVSLETNTTGGGNTAMGTRALEGNISGSNNSALGHIASVGSGGLSNATAIGYFSNVDASNKVRIGNGSVNSIGGQVGWTNFSDARIKDDVREEVVGLEFIKALRPVTYHYNLDRQRDLMGLEERPEWEGMRDIEKIAFSGFLAQEVQAAAEQTGYDFSGVDQSGEVMGIRYAEFTVPLVKAVQEQQAQIEALKAQLAEEQAEKAALMQRLDRIEASLGISSEVAK